MTVYTREDWPAAVLAAADQLSALHDEILAYLAAVMAAHPQPPGADPAASAAQLRDELIGGVTLLGRASETILAVMKAAS